MDSQVRVTIVIHLGAAPQDEQGVQGGGILRWNTR